jgi:hypothetical protein
MSRTVAALFSARHGREPICGMRGRVQRRDARGRSFPASAGPSIMYLELDCVCHWPVTRANDRVLCAYSSVITNQQPSLAALLIWTVAGFPFVSWM